ncbi:hypothetical protein CONPUDRAFT_164229 [Coniophora puteana RWD-64-598 SS2]|uniref:F-box domain-containing protein n=1 Tax=Coniophora puteana (strain RWD-64-598) TaxID=741705 RepID=A0A5M3MX91_CONPW|nr:uncharacterized protein CONPUDRAFT_164229 [Coniophora puteana RWD-64-598 SS2]EIW83251.1 hypothetical protein CONPUDRAFT_164229 [Coniophora puteana RWD-64-598 SS2]
MASKPTSFDQLPHDVLVELAAHLDIQDVLHLRQTSEQLRQASYDRGVWSSLYRRSHLPRPRGPYPPQTREELEDTLIRSFTVRNNLFTTPMKAPSFHTYDVGQETSARLVLVGSRYALTIDTSRTRITCRDLKQEAVLDATASTLWQIEDGTELRVFDLRHFDVMTYGGHKTTLVLVEQREKDDRFLFRNYGPVRLDIFRLIESEPSGAGVHLENLCQHSLTLKNPQNPYINHRLSVRASPSTLLAQWEREENTFLWSIEDLSKEPVKFTHSPIVPPSYIACRTHLFSFLLSVHLNVTIIAAAPLTEVFAQGSIHPTVRGMVRGHFSKIQMLRDAVVDPETGTTEVILSALQTGQQIVILRLRIPSKPTGHPQNNLLVDIQELMAVPFTSRSVEFISPSWTGSMRILLSRVYMHVRGQERVEREDTRPRFDIVEVVWDEEKHQARRSVSEDVSIPDEALAKMDAGGSLLLSFESENGSGKLVFDYPAYVDDAGRSKKRILGVLDFAV